MDSVRATLSVAILGLVVSTMACTTEQADPEADAEGALSGGGQDFAKGDQLVTTGNLNLRDQPSVSGKILAVMPKGATVKVSQVVEDVEPSNPANADLVPDQDPSNTTGDDLPEVTDDGLATANLTPDLSPSEDGDTPAPAPATQAPDDRLVQPPRSNPTSGFWFITYKNKSGWASGNYLRKVSATSAPSQQIASSSTCMTRLADVSLRRNGYHWAGACYSWVKTDIGSVLGIGKSGVQAWLPASYQAYASSFARWVESDPGGRASAQGFSIASNPNLDSLPRGAILVYAPGQCGFSPTAGHIEISVGGGKACSDFCGNIKRNCSAPTVILWNGSCR